MFSVVDRLKYSIGVKPSDNHLKGMRRLPRTFAPIKYVQMRKSDAEKRKKKKCFAFALKHLRAHSNLARLQ